MTTLPMYYSGVSMAPYPSGCNLGVHDYSIQVLLGGGNMAACPPESNLGTHIYHPKYYLECQWQHTPLDNLGLPLHTGPDYTRGAQYIICCGPRCYLGAHSPSESPPFCPPR